MNLQYIEQETLTKLTQSKVADSDRAYQNGPNRVKKNHLTYFGMIFQLRTELVHIFMFYVVT